MSLRRQIVTLLDLATGPLSVATMVAQIAALGGDAHADAVHKCMHQMKGAGQAKREGDGWVLVDGLPLKNLRAKWARDDQPAPVVTAPLPVAHKPPTLRDRIVQALREHPGMTAAELGAHLGNLSDNEPASSLNILGKANRVRHEGEWPARRYFACDDSERLVLPRAGKRKKSGAESGLAKPAEAVADAPAAAAAAVDVIAEVERVLELHGTWCIPAFVATAMELDRAVAADALDQLVANGRAASRYVSTLERAKQYAHVSVTAQTEDVQKPDTPDEATTTSSMPTAPAKPCVPNAEETTPIRSDANGRADGLPGAVGDHSPDAGKMVDHAGLRELAARDALLHAAQGASTALHEAAKVIEELAEEVDELDKAIGANPATLTGYARCIALDLEDAIGRACDERADHAAIKALSVALGSTWRAITQLSPGA